jgi:hypothetical protein
MCYHNKLITHKRLKNKRILIILLKFQSGVIDILEIEGEDENGRFIIEPSLLI